KASMVPPMSDPSSRAATRTAAISATPRSRFERWQHAVCRARFDTVVAGLRSVQEQGEREPADRLVDVVDARDPVALEHLDARPACIGRLDADDRDRRRDQARVEACEEPRRSVVLSGGGPHDDYAVGRATLASCPFRDDLRGEGRPERRLTAGCELLGLALAVR